jgi:hypothetical protein
MTSFRQNEANRRNATKSTGPITEEGKRRSRQNAVRHGLCAETVVEIVEDIDDYRSFETAIIADYDARTAVERELVLRLASLLWRLRRATGIETDLLRIQAEIVRDIREKRAEQAADSRTLHLLTTVEDRRGNEDKSKTWPAERFEFAPPNDSSRQLTLCFQRIAHLDVGTFELLGRYESSIARQVLKTIFLLRSIHHRM